jgi:diacylglycerol kinase (ATP)
MEITSQRWAVIINPKSGKKKFRLQLKYLFLTLRHQKISFDYKITEFAGHATVLARHFAESGYANFLVVGGDGTVSEVINGLLNAKISTTQHLKLALIPRGTGNDWGRFWGLTRDYKHSVNVFLNGKTCNIDVGKVNYNLEGESRTRFFINSIGFGLDALVCRDTNIMKRYVGSHSVLYLFALIAAVFTFRPRKAHIQSEEKEILDNMFTMNIANGCYSGGGMKQNPHALPNDGLFDVMMVKKPTLGIILQALPLIFNGRILEVRVIESFRTKKITFKCEHNGIFEADGIIFNFSSPAEVSIIENAIQMVVPESYNEK